MVIRDPIFTFRYFIRNKELFCRISLTFLAAVTEIKGRVCCVTLIYSHDHTQLPSFCLLQGGALNNMYVL